MVEADAALAASIFHYGTYTVDDLKQHLEHTGFRSGESAYDHPVH
jgi:imidazole glycerol phosphate synthase subunit HisF